MHAKCVELYSVPSCKSTASACAGMFCMNDKSTQAMCTLWRRMFVSTLYLIILGILASTTLHGNESGED